jgi:hypothetical protein
MTIDDFEDVELTAYYKIFHNFDIPRGEFLEYVKIAFNDFQEEHIHMIHSGEGDKKFIECVNSFIIYLIHLNDCEAMRCIVDICTPQFLDIIKYRGLYNYAISINHIEIADIINLFNLVIKTHK